MEIPPGYGEFPGEVSGWLTPLEGEKLFQLATGLTVLEIGSYQGKSTICLAQSARHVVSLDWHRGDADVGNTRTLAALVANLEHYRLHQKVTAIVGKVEDVGPFLADGVFGMAFIDGGHDEANVTRDTLLCKRLVKPGGVIAFHDWGEVGRFVRPLMGDLADGLVDSLVWFCV